MATQNNWKRALVVGGFIVMLIVVAAVGLSTYFINRVSTTVTTLFARTDVAEFVAVHFYEAIRNRNYAAAFGDLDHHAALNGQPLDEQAFIKDVTDVEMQRGALFSYGLVRQSDVTAPAITEFAASLRRSDQPYIVHIQLRQVGDRWKIISIDGL